MYIRICLGWICILFFIYVCIHIFIYIAKKPDVCIEKCLIFIAIPCRGQLSRRNDKS